MYELPHELPNHLRLKKLGIFTAFSPLGGLLGPHKKKKKQRLKELGNFKKIPEMLWFDGDYPAVHLKAKF